MRILTFKHQLIGYFTLGYIVPGGPGEVSITKEDLAADQQDRMVDKLVSQENGIRIRLRPNPIYQPVISVVRFNKVRIVNGEKIDDSPNGNRSDQKNGQCPK